MPFPAQRSLFLGLPPAPKLAICRSLILSYPDTAFILCIGSPSSQKANSFGTTTSVCYTHKCNPSPSPAALGKPCRWNSEVLSILVQWRIQGHGTAEPGTGQTYPQEDTTLPEACGRKTSWSLTPQPLAFPSFLTFSD